MGVHSQSRFVDKIMNTDCVASYASLNSYLSLLLLGLLV